MVSWKSESRKWTPPKANGASWLFVVLSIALFMMLKCSVIDAGAQIGPIVVPVPTRMPSPPVYQNIVYLPLIVR